MPVLDASLPLTLSQTMGAVLRAVIEAEAEAARTTVEYIERVGFERLPDGTEALRTVRFRYQKLDENQVDAAFVAEIPLLAMADIPRVSVKKAKFSFNYEVTRASTDVTAASGTTARFGVVPATLAGRVAKSPSGSMSERGDLHVEVELEKSPLPIGLDRIIDALDAAARERQET